MSVGLSKHREAPCKHIIAHCLSKEGSMDIQPTCRSICELQRGYFHAPGPEPSRKTEACSYGELPVALETVITVLPFWWLQRRSLLGQGPVLDGQHTLKIL